MAYDAYGRPMRSNGDQASAAADYTNPNHSNHSQNYYDSNEPRDSVPFYPRPHLHREPINPRRRESPPVGGKMASAADRGEQVPVGPDGVSPELIAAITEKVKREVFEQLKQTGSVEIPSQGPPMQRQFSNKSSSTSSPPPTANRVYTPPSPTQTGRSSYAQSFVPPAMDPMRSHPGSPLGEPLGGNRFADRGPLSPSSTDKSSGVRFSDRSAAARPTGNRTYSKMELSTIDQKWGRLFESDGKPTQRLGQFLRGLANHIIEDFPAKRSIVVTPSKMAAYYAAHALEKEPHPLLTIFQAHSNEPISRLYQDLGCQHHLVQEDSHSAPIIPALTPVGFAHWMTINILAYPEAESERLGKVVLAMPIDADGDLVDGKPERLPKQVSRHLLPDREDRSSRKLLDSAIENFLDDLGSSSRRKASITSPPLGRHSSSTSRPRSGSPPRGASAARSYGPTPVEIHQTCTSPPTTKAQPIERERKPYGGVPSNSETSNNEEGVRIERDRQPYSAQPGSGKNHIDNLNPSSTRSARANSTSSRSSAREQQEQGDLGHARTNSSTSQNKYPPQAGARRGSSPPFKSFSQSTPDNIHSTSSNYGANPSSSSSSSFTTNPSSTFNPSSRGPDPVFPPPPSGYPPVDIHRRSRDERQYRRGAEDEARFTGEFNSPRDAEKWDRYEEAARGEDRFAGYERGPVSIDPRDKGAPVEEWYREKGRGAEYDGPRRY